MLRAELRADVENVFNQFDNLDNVQHEIDPEVNISYNTLNLFLGQRGSGNRLLFFIELLLKFAKQ